MKASALYRDLREALTSAAGEGASYEAREILSELLGKPFPMILASYEELSADVVSRAMDVAKRRACGEPLAYILGFAYFYGLRFSVSPACLIPQADTEIVTEKTVSHLKKGMRFADICTGSGCIALAALHETEGTEAYAYDLSEGALAVARENAEALGLEGRFHAIHADVFAKDFLADAGLFDLIVSNPPYIPTSVIGTLESDVQAEPHMALDGGADGLDFYRRLLDVCPAHIRKGGVLLLEIGYDQRETLSALCEERGLAYEIFRDFGGNDRVCLVKI